MGKLNWGKRAYAVFFLCAATAIALPAQTLTTLHSFDGTDGASSTRGWSRPPMGTCTGQRSRAGPMALARSSKSPRAAR